MSATADVIIIGAGIVGAACARAFAREGMRVTVVERATPGGGATAAGMGHIVVMDDTDDEFAITRYSRDLWHELKAELPREVEFQACGTLWVAADDEEMNAVLRKHRYYGGRGVATEILDAAALAEAEPNLRPGLAGALLVPGDIVIYSPCAAAWLLEQSGGTLIYSSAAELRDGGVALADGTRVEAGITICATGAWASELVPGIDVRPRKGHLAITDRYPGFVRHQLVELGYLKSAHGSATESVAFNAQPRATGQVLLGSSRQFGRADPGIDPAILGRMIRRGIEYMPALAQLSVIRTWTGVRAATPDNRPLIGPWPERKGVYLATGHEGLGITTSLATAQLLADMVAGREPAIPITPYLPARFA